MELLITTPSCAEASPQRALQLKPLLRVSDSELLALMAGADAIAEHGDDPFDDDDPEDAAVSWVS